LNRVFTARPALIDERPGASKHQPKPASAAFMFVIGVANLHAPPELLHEFMPPTSETVAGILHPQPSLLEVDVRQRLVEE